MKKKFSLVAICSTLLFAAPAVQAWDGTPSGKIVRMDVTTGNNFGVRVMLEGVASACTGGAAWGYLNESDSNYKVYVAMLMMAKAQGTPVTLFTTLTAGYCHIGYLSVGS